MSDAELRKAGWIPVDEKRPPLIADVPKSGGFFLLLRHNPAVDGEGQFTLHLWCGSVPITAKYWAPIPAYKGQ